ncbi:hypothetical protein MNBD_ACTINO02-2151 [hydrothermal vent metagenome]|uniref:Branched-chain-amino-acid aminotransferase-like protein 2 n=1 Tax=hydrothermal vent metagenome TaxID=652676 RepID=A0A3B0SVP4_9ZZZZ
MWSGPRNISTAIMYSFRERSDMEVFDEPLYGHYLVHTGINHPLRDATIADMDCDADSVINDLLHTRGATPHRFYKNMAHHLAGLDREFLGGLTNIILTRDPREMLPSLVAGFPAANLDSTGLVIQVELLEAMQRAGEAPIVLDAQQVLTNPKTVLTKLCASLGLPWDEAMLSWQPGPKPEDGVWASHWYTNVHASTGFGEYRPKSVAFPTELVPLLEQCEPLYARLREFAITA